MESKLNYDSFNKNRIGNKNESGEVFVTYCPRYDLVIVGKEHYFLISDVLRFYAFFQTIAYQ